MNKDGYNEPPVKKLSADLKSNSYEKVFGLKYDSGKPRYDLIPADALEEVAKVYTVGAKKYGDRNWEKGLSYSRLFGSLMRHAWAWWRGERDDKENKLHHLSSVIFCALGLLHYELNLEEFKGLDDRNNATL